jgi:membrane-associated protease RseP (regulator of RpoE activity)
MFLWFTSQLSLSTAVLNIIPAYSLDGMYDNFTIYFLFFIYFQVSQFF